MKKIFTLTLIVASLFYSCFLSEASAQSTFTFTDNFDRTGSDNLGADWLEVAGNMKIEGNSLHYDSSPDQATCVLAVNPNVGDLELKLDWYFESSIYSYGGLVFRYQDYSNYYWIFTDNWNHQLILYKKVGGSNTAIGTYSFTYAQDTWYALRVECEGAQIRVYQDDVLRIDVTDSTFSSGNVGITMDRNGASTGKADNFSVIELGESTPTVPVAPSPLVATQNGKDVDLSWTNVANETGYRVERKLQSESVWTVIQTLAADINSYTDTTTIYEAYDYQVMAVNAEGDSPAAAVQISVALNEPTFTAPTGTQAPGDVVFTWTSEVSSGAESYDLEIADNSSYANAIAINTASTTHTENLQTEQTYYYRVRSKASDGTTSIWVTGTVSVQVAQQGGGFTFTDDFNRLSNSFSVNSFGGVLRI